MIHNLSMFSSILHKLTVNTK